MEQHNAAQTARFHAHITHRKSEGHRGGPIEKVEKNGGIAACKNKFLGFFSPSSSRVSAGLRRPKKVSSTTRSTAMAAITPATIEYRPRWMAKKRMETSVARV